MEEGGELDGGVDFLMVVEVELADFDLVGLSEGKGLPWMSWFGVEW